MPPLPAATSTSRPFASVCKMIDAPPKSQSGPSVSGQLPPGRILRAAADHERVALELLMTPHDVAVIHVEREDRVAGVGGDRSVAVAGADINAPALRIDRRRIPHARA